MAQSLTIGEMDKYQKIYFRKSYPNHLKSFIKNPNKFISQVWLYNFNTICTATNNQKKHKKENPTLNKLREQVT